MNDTNEFPAFGFGKKAHRPKHINHPRRARSAAVAWQWPLWPSAWCCGPSSLRLGGSSPFISSSSPLSLSLSPLPLLSSSFLRSLLWPPQKSSSSPAAAAAAMLRPQYVNALLPSTAFPTERWLTKGGRGEEKRERRETPTNDRHTNILSSPLLCPVELKPHTVRDAYAQIGWIGLTDFMEGRVWVLVFGQLQSDSRSSNVSWFENITVERE